MHAVRDFGAFQLTPFRAAGRATGTCIASLNRVNLLMQFGEAWAATCRLSATARATIHRPHVPRSMHGPSRWCTRCAAKSLAGLFAPSCQPSWCGSHLGQARQNDRWTGKWIPRTRLGCRSDVTVQSSGPHATRSLDMVEQDASLTKLVLCVDHKTGTKDSSSARGKKAQHPKVQNFFFYSELLPKAT